MKFQEYVTKEEVKEVCKKLRIRNWTALTKPAVTKEEARKILKIVNTTGMNIPLEWFKHGLEVELEHGTMYKDANVTNNHPILTGMIVLAHLKETLDYYDRLEVAEIEGDLLKAITEKNPAKVEAKYRKLIKAKEILAQVESKTLR